MWFLFENALESTYGTVFTHRLWLIVELSLLLLVYHKMFKPHKVKKTYVISWNVEEKISFNWHILHTSRERERTARAWCAYRLSWKCHGQGRFYPDAYETAFLVSPLLTCLLVICSYTCTPVCLLFDIKYFK